VDAALAVADAEGLDAVTVRRLAQDLSVTPMALYWHFKDKDALLDGIGDRLWDETVRAIAAASSDAPSHAGSTAASGDTGWTQLGVALRAILDVMRRHPAVASLAPQRIVACESGLEVTERALAFLVARGFDLERASEMAHWALCSVEMLVTTQPGAALGSDVDVEEEKRHKRVLLASLPPDRFPHVVAAADYFTDCGAPDAYFARGIDMILAGLRMQTPPPRSVPAGAPAHATTRAARRR
jgi:TetR/AcrR family tetracycline transcriptional repressor